MATVKTRCRCAFPSITLVIGNFREIDLIKRLFNNQQACADLPKTYNRGLWKHYNTTVSGINHPTSNTTPLELQKILLDIGAGPGTISTSLAKYIPQGTVTATDISSDVLQQAETHAKNAGCTNIKFQIADAYKLPFADNTFDIVHASQVLGHLDDPVKALKEFIRVCVPGGIIGCRDADMRSWVAHPDLPALRDFFTLQGGLMPRTDTGLSLISFALKAGVRRSNIQFTTSTYGHTTEVERQAMGRAFRERARDGDLRRRAIEEGSKTAEDMDEIVNAWDTWVETEEACCACICGEIVVTKF